jgi:hypothetical protein
MQRTRSAFEMNIELSENASREFPATFEHAIPLHPRQ